MNELDRRTRVRYIEVVDDRRKDGGSDDLVYFRTYVYVYLEKENERCTRTKRKEFQGKKNNERRQTNSVLPKNVGQKEEKDSERK